MSIATDLKAYADRAASQGKQALDQAQAQLNDVTGQANEFYGRARTNVTEIADKAAGAAGGLRTSAEKAVNLDAIKSAVEPYVSQVLGYTSTVTERAEGLLAEARKDKRVASLIGAVDQVVDQVEAKVVKPVLSFAGRGQKPAGSTTESPAETTATAPRAARPAASKPASATSATKAAAKPAARKTTARKPAAPKAPKA